MMSVPPAVAGGFSWERGRLARIYFARAARPVNAPKARNVVAPGVSPGITATHSTFADPRWVGVFCYAWILVSTRLENVILDTDLALLYGVETRALIQAVKRNDKRFPLDFIFSVDKQRVRDFEIRVCDPKRQRRQMIPAIFLHAARKYARHSPPH
jgi:hypothetical protein